MSLFKQKHQEITAQVLLTLENFFDVKISQAEQKDQVLVEMVSVLKEFVLRGGKRVRPFLTVLAFEYGKSVSPRLSREFPSENSLEFSPQRREEILKVAGAVEMHHEYLLSLDDMADRDVLRHGGKTLEEYYSTEVFGKWPNARHHGRTFSEIAGGLLTSYTFELLASSGFSPELIAQAIPIIQDQLFSDTVTGWQLQYFQNHQPIIESTEQQFLKGLEFVTSRYTFIGPMKLGLLVSGNEDKVVERFFLNFGRHVGIAFQIQDDIMGLFGDPQKMGKAVGNDVREGKKTLLMLKAYEFGNSEEKKFIEKVIGTSLSDSDLQKLQEIVKKSGSLDYSQKMARQHVEKGIAELAILQVQSKEIEILRELAQYMVEREV